MDYPDVYIQLDEKTQCRIWDQNLRESTVSFLDDEGNAICVPKGIELFDLTRHDSVEDLTKPRPDDWTPTRMVPDMRRRYYLRPTNRYELRRDGALVAMFTAGLSITVSDGLCDMERHARGFDETF